MVKRRKFMKNSIKLTDLRLEWINKPKHSKIADKYFSFIVKTEFDSKHRYDQCGVIIYQDSDWATTDISVIHKFMYYRLSRRENDFCIESSYDGINYKQMRIFHLFSANEIINIGVYACSPENSSFCAEFSGLEFMDCKWEEHK
ncbi:DUF1349 domain-containing protein [Cetobacterium sp.]|uniref:DUF1349 domain-containing protein n=1 Tax=Cetobacterium sp. TaxID=2071632 RepID=UPI003F361CF3